MPNHPMQSIVRDERGTIRFRSNKIIDFLIESGRIDMNTLAVMDFPNEDRQQFAQLIGYSLKGYHELSYVTDAAAKAASKAARKKLGLGEEDLVGCRDGEGCSIHNDEMNAYD